MGGMMIPPPPADANPVEMAKYRQQAWGVRSLSTDELWLLRDVEQDIRNEIRYRNWELKRRLL